MSAIEALRAALAAGPTPGPFIAVGEVVESADDEVPDLCSTSDRAEPWGFGPEQRVKDAAYIAAACNAATELLAEVDRLTAERDALRADAERWRNLYRRAVNEANGLTNYVEDRPELRRAERNLTAIESEASAALKGEQA